MQFFLPQGQGDVSRGSWNEEQVGDSGKMSFPWRRWAMPLESGGSRGLPLLRARLHLHWLVASPSSMLFGSVSLKWLLQVKTEEADKERMSYPLTPRSPVVAWQAYKKHSGIRGTRVGGGEMSPQVQAIRWYMSGENLKSIMKPTKSLFFFIYDHHAVAIPNNISDKILFQKKLLLV